MKLQFPALQIFQGATDSAGTALANAVARCVVGLQDLLFRSGPIGSDEATQAAVARSKTVIGELEAEQRAAERRPSIATASDLASPSEPCLTRSASRLDQAA